MTALAAPAAEAPANAEVVRVHAETTATNRPLPDPCAGPAPGLGRTHGRGGPGEAVQAGELLLGALASCGLALVQKVALDDDAPAPLSAAQVEVSFERDPDDPTRYRYIRLEFALGGVDLPTAQRLVAAFTDTCPIYNTLRRGGQVDALARVV